MLRTSPSYPLLFLILMMLAACSEVNQQSRFERIDQFQSKLVADREVQIYLPPSYDFSDRSFPVLYMHDGQMLFDSTTTWNGQEWGVDEVMDSLTAVGKIRETIVVGVWNGGSSLRHPEYFPQKPFESLSQEVQDSLLQLGRGSGNPLFGNEVQSDKYLAFLVSELKPYIDEQYRTLEDQSNTYIAGSSMGGLISMYAISEYPEVFGGAICISTHWPGIFTVENNPVPEAFYNYLRSTLPDPSSHKLYFDYGTETLDALYEPLQLQVDQIIFSKGYTNDVFMTRKFEGADHSENSWKKRLHIPFTFLLKKQ